MDNVYSTFARRFSIYGTHISFVVSLFSSAFSFLSFLFFPYSHSHMLFRARYVYMLSNYKSLTAPIFLQLRCAPPSELDVKTA